MNRKSIPTSGVTYGYVRVSTRDQNESRQMVAMKQFGVPDRILFPTVWVRYTDKLIWAEL